LWHSCVKNKENILGESCICHYVIKNGWSCMDSIISSWWVFYLECDKGKDGGSYQVYIELCYSYVLVIPFFYKAKILYILCSNFRVENAFCHMTIVTTGR
jgi:hypothetical protein